MTLITPDLGIIFWQTITFLTVLLVLSKYAWEPILAVLKDREHAIAHALDQITKAQELMAQTTSERMKLLSMANLERERIIGEALKTQEEIIDQARQEGLKVKEHLLTQARIEISREEEHAMESLRVKAGLLAIQIGEKLLVKELSQEQSQLDLIEQLVIEKTLPLNRAQHYAC